MRIIDEGSYSSERYLLRIFANGLAFGVSSDNSFVVIKESDERMHARFIAEGKWGFDIAKDSFRLIIGGVWYSSTYKNGSLALTQV